MSTISEFAKTLKMPVEQLLGLCQRAGLEKQDDEDSVSDKDKKHLIQYLRSLSGTGATSVSSRASSSRQVEIQRSGAPGRNRVKVKVKGRYRAPPPPPQATPKPPREAPPPPELEAEPAAVPVEVAPPPVEKKPKAEPRREAKPPARAAAPARASARKGKARPSKTREHRGKVTQDREKRRGQLHIDEQRQRKPRSKKQGKVVVDNKHQFTEPTAQIVREVELSGPMTVAELAMAMAVKSPEVVKTLFSLGETSTINDVLNPDTVELVVETLGHKIRRVNPEDVEADLLLDSSVQGEVESRPPVVTFMGHVDHGKTSLLDYIRKTRVAAGEAGGITQHIGAYQVETAHGRISFLDTPGHAAFTAMRGRGAQCTDLVILVVAADDGVKPQTEEAVKHIKEAKVPAIVAVNKMDRENADIEQVKTQLAALDVRTEEWGGDTMFIPVSAKTGEGVKELLEAISLQAEVLELKAPATGPATGTVIESSLDRGRGATASILVQTGQLRQRDMLLCGKEFGRVKAMFDDQGQQMKEAGPATPVLVLGLSGVPQAGDGMYVVADEQKAREIVRYREAQLSHHQVSMSSRESALAMMDRMGQEQVTSLNVIIKADVRGSAEALRESLEKLSTDEAQVKIVLCGIGGINESDALLADAAKAILLGFNVRADNAARSTIAECGLDLRYYNVIYELIDDVKALLEKQLPPEVREEIVGLALVREVFRSSKMGPVAGCQVTEGTVQRDYPIRVLRDNVVIYEGQLESLRRFKDNVNEVPSGTECGIAVANYNDVRAGDQIEVFRRIETARTL